MQSPIKWIRVSSLQQSLVGWLFGYFSLYQAVSQRVGERGENGYRRVKMSKQPSPALTASAVGPCPTLIQISKTPGTGSLPSTIAPSDRPSTVCLLKKHSRDYIKLQSDM